jgi:hypothetical protein
VLSPTLAALAVLTVESPAPLPTSSPTDQLITVTAAGVASIVVAAIGAWGLRRRRQVEADAIPLPPAVALDMEDRPSRIRERLTRLETRADITDRDLTDVKEQLQLHRAVDVVTEASMAPRRRRRDTPT